MTRIAAVDVDYDEDADTARAACVVFSDWADAEPIGIYAHTIRGLMPYIPGSFYLRELPALEPLLARVQRRHELHTVVVDGHVWLRGDRPGLGAHLHQALGGRLEIVGVAKNAFREGPALPVLRGTSANALWVTSTGDPRVAADHVLHMHGEHRKPTLLTLVDHACRGHVEATEV